MVVTAVIPAAASAWPRAYIDVLEDLAGATQTTRHQVGIPLPLTPGATVTVTEPANPSLVSCVVVGVGNTLM